MTPEFLDNQQYTELSILRYEAIYGHNYISPGGENTTDQFIDTLKLLPKMRVLDIGCGLGGPAYRMASKYGVYVHGIDLSANMIRIAKTRLKEEGLNIWWHWYREIAWKYKRKRPLMWFTVVMFFYTSKTKHICLK